MKLLIKVYNRNGQYILSDKVIFGVGWYDVALVSDLHKRLYNDIDKCLIPDILVTEKERTKRFNLEIHLNKETGRYDVVRIKPEHLLSQSEMVADVCDYFNITKEEIMRQSRQVRIIKPRHFAMFLLWAIKKMKITEIRDMFHKDAHATVIHAIKKGIVGYYRINDYETMDAVQYFSSKYGVQLSKILDEIDKGEILNSVDRG